MISEKITGEPKEFAFIEFFSVDEATCALNSMKRNPVKIKGIPLFVTFSKIRKPEDFKDLNDRLDCPQMDSYPSQVS